MMNLKNIIKLLFFVFAFTSTGCCNFKKTGKAVAMNKANPIDTIITIDSTTVLKANDTIVILSENTANAICKPIPAVNNKKYKYLISHLCEILTKRYEYIEIAGYRFDLNALDSNDSLLIYEKKYYNYVSYDVIRSVKIRHSVMTLDFRDRKMFYGVMNYFENYLGHADSYAFRSQGNEINRELAHFVSWKIDNLLITIEDHELANCMQEIKHRHIFNIKIKPLSHDKA